MNVTTGVDIIEVERIKKAAQELGDSFLNRIYTQDEIEYCACASDVKYQHLAARFAAKEAVFKALSNYINSREDILWKEIEIKNDEGGRPKIDIDKLKSSKLTENKLDDLESIDISITHIKEYAVASVVALFK